MDIKKSNNTPLQSSSNSWVFMAEFLLSNEATGEWSSTHKSFTEWLIDVSKKLSLSESSLWRYYRAAKFYTNLQEELKIYKITAPEFKTLSAKISPENLEILEKIERVTPRDVFITLAKRVLSANIKRNELRSTWIAYRKSLDGKTSRGTGVSRPKIDLADPKNQASINEAQVLVCLNSPDNNWMGMENKNKYEVVTPNFCLMQKNDGGKRICFDAMIVLENNSGLEFHGVEIKSNNNPRQDYLPLDAQAKYCDYIWIAFCEFNSDYGTKKTPNNCGILALDNKKLTLIRKPKRNDPAYKLETSLQLLTHFLKR